MNIEAIRQSSWARWLTTLILVLVTGLEVLDMTIVSVSLQNMRGSLGATSDQISWTVTSYMVMSAVVMPLTGFLTARLGRKRLLFIVIVGFGFFSALCGLSTSLNEIVLFRGLQGAFGALLAPISQAIINELFANRPETEKNQSMALYGIGLMTAPVFGPLLGGYLTQNINWRWDFFINIPICIIVIPLIAIFIKETKKRDFKIDWLGMGLMALAVGCLQIVLDQGSSKDWFSSNEIIVLSALSLIGFVFFISRGLRLGKANIIDLMIFKDRLFSGSIILIAGFCLVFIGIVSWLPLFLESLLHYPALTAGTVLAPRGIFAAVSMVVLPGLMRRVPGHYIVMLGFVLTALSAYLMVSTFSLQIDEYTVLLPNIIQGLAIGCVFLPVSRAFYGSLSKEHYDEAAGMFSFARSIGGSIGVSIMGTIFTRLSQVNWNELGGQVSIFNPNLTKWLTVNQLNLHEPQTTQRLADLVGEQASMLAFNDVFYFSMVVAVIFIPCALLLRLKKLK